MMKIIGNIEGVATDGMGTSVTVTFERTYEQCLNENVGPVQIAVTLTSNGTKQSNHSSLSAFVSLDDLELIVAALRT